MLGAGPALLDSPPPQGHDLAQMIEPRTRPIGDFGFQGTFVSEDVVLPGSLQVDEHKVTLWASGAQLASWSISDCKVERAKDDQFSIEAEGETVTFTPDDPDGLSAAITVFMTPPASPSIDAKVVTAKGSRTPTNPIGKTKAKAAKTKPVVKAPETPASEKPASETSGPEAGTTLQPRLPETDGAPADSDPISPPAASASKSPTISRPRIKAFMAKSRGGGAGPAWPVAAESTSDDGIAAAVPPTHQPDAEAEPA